MRAAGQIFFSLSVGFGLILCYSSYLRRNDDVVLTSLTAVSTNEFCEVILGGLIVVPAAILFLGPGNTPDSTFAIGFFTVPAVMHFMPIGWLFGGLWFGLLFVAAVTSSISMLHSAAERVLLTHHKRLGKWLQPGGHADGDADVVRVAHREAEEESGLNTIDLVSGELFDVDIHLIPARRDEPEHFHYDCRFLFRSGGSDEFVVSEESINLAWVRLDKVHEFNDEPSIIRMVNKTRSVMRLTQRDGRQPPGHLRS